MATVKELREKISWVNDAAQSAGWSDRERLVIIGAIAEAHVGPKKAGRPKAKVSEDELMRTTYELVQEHEGPMSVAAAHERVAVIMGISGTDPGRVIRRRLKNRSDRETKRKGAKSPATSSSLLGGDDGQ